MLCFSSVILHNTWQQLADSRAYAQSTANAKKYFELSEGTIPIGRQRLYDNCITTIRLISKNLVSTVDVKYLRRLKFENG